MQLLMKLETVYFFLGLQESCSSTVYVENVHESNFQVKPNRFWRHPQIGGGQN